VTWLRPLRVFWRDKWLLAAAFILLWLARIELYVTGFGDTRKGCALTADLPLPPTALSARVAWSVNRAARFVVRPTCLVRAMAGRRLLALKGYGSRIFVGVRSSSDAGLEAHAWLCAGDAVVLGNASGEVREYLPLIGNS
jgi:hypothetical protein